MLNTALSASRLGDLLRAAGKVAEIFSWKYKEVVLGLCVGVCLKLDSELEDLCGVLD